MEEDKRDSLIFYRSFYEALKEVDNDTKAKVYDAIFEYSLNFNDVELTGLSKAMFTLIKPQLDANNQRFKNGNKGGRPKKDKPNDNQEITKTKPNDNQNETKPKANKNVNDNVNKNKEREESEQSSDDPILFDLDVTNQPQEVKLTKALFDLFRNNQKEKGVTVFTRYDKSKLSTWLPHIEKMINIDGVTYEDFKILYTWLGSNYREAEFWKKNILSTQKLREQYPKLQQAINSDAVLANKLKQEQSNKFKNKTMSL